MSSNVKGKSVKGEKERNVQVFVRVRPMNAAEKNAKSYAVVNCNGKEVVVKERPIEKHTKTFSFDKVFGPDSKQLDVYKSVVHPLIEEVLAGYNCTVFAYGQTGTGKTFTMEGGKSNDPAISWEDDPLSGIIPRSLSHLFDELRFLQVEHTVRVSFLELYNEEIFDLLSAGDDTTKLRLFEDTARKGSVIIQGLEELTVHNKNEVYKIMEKGSLKRTTAATLMNAQSSRSHTVFSITVHIKDNSVDGEELLKTGKLNLVDLAGSENIGRSGAIDKRAREAGNINQSLLTLGRCITSLVEHCPHIPYRESKLTRLLQESLGGRTKTSIIATISPALSNLEETLSTLEYAHRAKNITNRPEINQKLSKRALLKEYTEEIERLRRDLEACREKNGVYIAQDNYANMIIQIEQQEEEIMNKISSIKAIKEEMDKKEELLNMLNMKLDRAKDIICKTRDERDESRHLIEKHLQLEQQLTEQAKQLTQAVQLSANDTEILHQKLERKTRIEEINMQASNKLAKKLQTSNNQLCKKIEVHNENQQQLIQTHQKLLQDNYEEHKRSSEIVKSVLVKLEQLQKNIQQHSQKLQHQNDERLSDVQSHHEQVINMTSKDKEHVLQTSNYIQNELNALSQQLNSLYDNEIESFNSLNSHTKQLQELIENCGEVEKDMLAIQTNLQQLTKMCAHKLMNIKLNENDVYEKGVERNNVLVEKVETIHNWMENMIKYTCDIKELLDQNKEGQQRDAMLMEINEMSTVIDRVQQIPNEHINKLIGKNENMNNKLKSFTTQLTNHTTHNSNKCMEMVVNSRDVTNSINTNFQQMVNEQVCCLDSYNHHSSQHVHQFCHNLNECNNEIENRSQVLSQQMETDVNEIGNITQQTMDRQDKLVQVTKQQFEIQTNEGNKFTDSADGALKEQNNLLNEYIRHDFQTDFSTGQTPQRRELHYPKHLAVMSPHERLLQRFRTQRPSRTALNDISGLDLEIDIVDIVDGSDKENESVTDGFSDVNTSSMSDQGNTKKRENVKATLFKKPKSR